MEVDHASQIPTRVFALCPSVRVAGRRASGGRSLLGQEHPLRFNENAYIKAHHLAISADIDGRAVRVLVWENDRAKRGDLLFELDPEKHKIDISKADAELSGIRNTLDALRAEYRTAEADCATRSRELNITGASSSVSDS